MYEILGDTDEALQLSDVVPSQLVRLVRSSTAAAPPSVLDIIPNFLAFTGDE